MFKGDSIKRDSGWSIVYSIPNNGMISEIPLCQYSIEVIEKKFGLKTKFLPNVKFVIDNRKAVIQWEETEKVVKTLENEKSSEKNPFSLDENEIIDILNNAYKNFSNLERVEESDVKDFLFHIKSLKRILGQLVIRRDYPNGIFD